MASGSEEVKDEAPGETEEPRVHLSGESETAQLEHGWHGFPPPLNTLNAQFPTRQVMR